VILNIRTLKIYKKYVIFIISFASIRIAILGGGIAFLSTSSFFFDVLDVDGSVSFLLFSSSGPI